MLSQSFYSSFSPVATVLLPLGRYTGERCSHCSMHWSPVWMDLWSLGGKAQTMVVLYISIDTKWPWICKRMAQFQFLTSQSFSTFLWGSHFTGEHRLLVYWKELSGWKKRHLPLSTWMARNSRRVTWTPSKYWDKIKWDFLHAKGNIALLLQRALIRRIPVKRVWRTGFEVQQRYK